MVTGLSKSTYYYELNHIDFDEIKNQEIINEIKKI